MWEVFVSDPLRPGQEFCSEAFCPPSVCPGHFFIGLGQHSVKDIRVLQELVKGQVPAAFFAVKIDRPADHLPLGFCKEAGRIEQGSCQHGSVWTVFSGNAGLIAPEIVQKTREIGEIFIKTSFFAMRTAMRAVPKRWAEACVRSAGEDM